MPDFSRLLRRPRIEKPQEEFQVPPPAEVSERPLAAAPPPAPTLVEELEAEAARLQELYDLVVETAEEVEVPVPEPEQQLYGPVLRTRDYLNALRQRGPRARRLRQTFEDGLLEQGACTGSSAWPILGAGRILSFQDGLLGAAQILEGALLADVMRAEEQREQARPAEAPAPRAPVAPDSQLNQVSRELLTQSRTYRARFAQTVASMRADLSEEVLRCLFHSVGKDAVDDLRPQLRELLSLLRQVRQLLCVAMLLRMLEFRQVREALEALFESMALEMFTQLLARMIERLQQAIMSPLLDQLLAPSGRGGHGCDLLSLTGGVTARALGETLYGAMYSLNTQFTEVLSDLLRESRNRTRGALSELQVLGERNTIGRWANHLDEAIALIEHLLSQVGSLEGARRLLEAFVTRPLAPTSSRLYRRLADHPEYRDALSLNWEFRRFEREPVT